MFISLRWKAIFLFSILLLGLSAYFTYVSDAELKRLLTSQRSQTLNNNNNEISGLLKQSYDHLLQLSDIIPLLRTTATINNTQPEDSLNTILASNWEYIQINWGLESATLFSQQGTLLKEWGTRQNSNTDATIKKVSETGIPSNQISCKQQCQQVVTIPIMSPDGSGLILEISTSLADTLRTFQRITRSDIGLLTNNNAGGGPTRLKLWSKTLGAMTNLNLMRDILKTASDQIDFEALKKSPQVIQYQQQHIEIGLIDIQPSEFSGAYFIIVEDVTKQYLQISNAKKENITSALGAVLLSSLLILATLWNPIIRLRRQSELLPLLVEGNFQYVRDKLNENNKRHWFHDEIDILDAAEIDVTNQLESMQDEILKNTNKLKNLAMYDSLTGLDNRYSILKYINNSLRDSRSTGKIFALLFLDLDNFKRINDSLGHKQGDELLKIVAKRLVACVRGSDTVARLGGDEFCILIRRLRTEQDSAIVASNILKILTNPIHLGNTEVIVSTSIGIVAAPRDGSSTEELLQNADIAMYRAKAQGRNKYQLFTQEMNIEVIEQMALETELRQAVSENQFVLYYQPQVDLSNNQIIGAEALVRWMHPTKGLIPPVRFIPLMEETGLIVPLGEWVIYEACLAAQQWITNGLKPITISINLSPRQFLDPNIVGIIEHTLTSTGLAPEYMELEITESMAMNDVKHSNQILKDLKSLGITVAVDDFGTGHSSLSYLKTLSLDVLKIDRSFIMDIPTDENDKEITAAIIAMAHKLKLRVVAEGIETPEQLLFLIENRCEIGQGYLFSKPLPEHEFIALLKTSLNIAQLTTL